MEGNIAYDQGPVRIPDNDIIKDGPRRRKAQEEETEIPQEIREGTKLAHRISTTDTVAGMYALILLSVGIAFPVSEYTSPSGDTKRRDALDTGFELFVFIISLGFQLYIAIQTRLLLRKSKTKKQEDHELTTKKAVGSDPNSTTENVFVVGAHIHKDVDIVRQVTEMNKNVSWHFWHKLAPPVYHIKYGFSIFTRLGILIFGLSAVALDICRLIDYGHDDHIFCRYDAKIALIVIRMIFTIAQTFFIFIHHDVIFNFHHPLIKFGLLHMIAANLITWIKTVARDSAETYSLIEAQGIISSGHNNSSSISGEPTLAERFCVSFNGLEYRVANYLAPLVIEYCVLAAALLYKRYSDIGPKLYLEPTYNDIWEEAQGGGHKGKFYKNIGFMIGLPLFLATVGVTVWDMTLSDISNKDISVVLTQGRIATACNLTWNILIIIALFPAFYSINKLRYEPKPTGTIEHVMLVTLGGTFIFLGFITVASFMLIHDPNDGMMATMGLPGCLINFIQSVAMFVFTVDAFRRKVTDVNKPHGESAVVFLIFANISMWFVCSFQWKYSFGSVLFFRKFGGLSWILILNSTLPLATFYRFIICILLMQVVRDTYGHQGRRFKEILKKSFSLHRK